MSSVMIGLIGVILLIVLLFTGLHVGIAMIMVGFLGCWVLCGELSIAFGYMQTVPFSTASSFSLSVIPMFVLMGQIAYHAGISSALYDACYKILNRLRGGLAIATVLACSGFAAICGSANATTATMGTVCLPEMKKYNYKDSLSCGVISAGGTLGILIPPSIGFMLYAISAEIAVGKMFMAGILPGIILAGCYAIVVYLTCLRDPSAGPKGPRYSLKERLNSVKGIVPVILLFILVLGGIYFGWFTPNEGGAVGAFGTMVFMIILGKFTWKNMFTSLKDTVDTTAMIFLIAIGAYIFGYFVTMSGLSSALASWATESGLSPVWVIIFCLFVYAILGCFIDSLPLIILLTPIFLPIVEQIGFNPIWFGVLMVMVMQLGLITPPVGLSCYIISGIAEDISLGTIFKGTFPFVIALLVAIGIVIVFPVLATWLPGMM